MKENQLKNNFTKVCGVAYDFIDVERVIQFCLKHNFHYYYIKHNDYDENMNEKKEHFHFVIESDSQHRFNIKSLLTDTFKCNLIEKCANVGQYVRYMTHIDFVDKQHYSYDSIVSSRSSDYIKDLIECCNLKQSEINNENFKMILLHILNFEFHSFKEIISFCIDNDIKYLPSWTFTIKELLKEYNPFKKE